MAKTEKTKEKGSVTVADLIVMLAFAFFAVFTYFGLAFKHGSSTCVLYVLLYIVALFALLYALTWTKKVNNDFTKWKIVEVALLVVFVVVSIKISEPMVNALSATSQKDNLISTGQSDIDRINLLFDDYEAKEADNITEIKASFRSLQNSRLDSEAKNIIQQTRGDDTYEKYCDDILYGKYLSDSGEGELNYLAFKQRQQRELQDAYQALSNWNLVKVSSIASNLISRYDKIADRLTAISSQRHPNHPDVPYKYVLKRNAESRYVIDVDKTASLEVDYFAYKKELNFPAKISEAKSPVAVVLAVIVFILMLIGYFAAPRSTTVPIIGRGKKSKIEDGGISLYE